MAATQTLSIADLQPIARRIRRHIIRMTLEAQSGHPAGSLSCVEILTALYFRVMRHDPRNPHAPDRDRLIVSKGHATPGVYAAMAEAGYLRSDELLTFRKLGSRLQGHTVMNVPPGVEMSAGALGMGLSFALGQALAGRLDGLSYRVYCLLSDGDCEEGQTWEAIMACAHQRVDNLTAIVDRNHIQNDGYSDYLRFGNRDVPSRPGGWVMEDLHTANIMSLEPFPDKWRAFGWRVWHLVDGHDFQALIAALEEAKAHKGGPSVIIAETIKGKGVSFMENSADFHGKAPSPEEAEQALKELAD